MDKELKKAIDIDKENYKDKNNIKNLFYILSRNKRSIYKKMIILSRKYNFYKKNKNKNIKSRVLYCIYSLKFNIMSLKYNIWLEGNFGNGIKIFHENVTINQYAIVGNNCTFHGNNCIGNNNDKDFKKCPKIGNNVEIGYGATIIGDIEIADDIVIGANSLVNKSFKEKGIIIAGNPAKKIR